jgi:hypothetical protein
MLSFRKIQDVSEADAHYTDTLWLRLVNHALIDAVDADVAFTQSLPRGDNIRGPVPTFSVESWLPTNQNVVTLELRGDMLQAALKAAFASAATVDFEHQVVVAGASEDGLVGGRPLDPRRRYRVVITDKALDGVVLKDVLGAETRQTRFVQQELSYVVDAEAGSALPLRTVVLARIEQVGGAEAGGKRLVDELLIERIEPVPEFRFRVEELAGQGSAYRNTPNNLPSFAETRETRSTTPDLYTLGLRLRADFTFDHPTFAVELGSRVLWNTVILDIEGVDLPPQEQADDVQLWTEVRLNNLRLSLGSGGFGIVPYVRAALDSEITATPLPSDPKQSLPHQLLLPQSIGLVASPNGVLREVRLGAVLQEDLSGLPGGDPARFDAGIVAGLRLDVPLWKFVLQSENDLRYLISDGDDRATDLALRLMSTLKLVLPINATTNVFVFADAFVVSGKTDVNREPGGSVILGGGMGFCRLVRVALVVRSYRRATPASARESRAHPLVACAYPAARAVADARTSATVHGLDLFDAMGAPQQRRQPIEHPVQPRPLRSRGRVGTSTTSSMTSSIACAAAAPASNACKCADRRATAHHRRAAGLPDAEPQGLSLGSVNVR